MYILRIAFDGSPNEAKSKTKNVETKKSKNHFFAGENTYVHILLGDS